MTVTVTLGTVWPYFVQGHSYDVRPRYVLYAGLLFQPLNLDLLEGYHFHLSDLRVRHFFDYYVLDQIYFKRPDVSDLSNINTYDINTYLALYRGSIINEVNDKKMLKLDDLAKAFQEKAD